MSLGESVFMCDRERMRGKEKLFVGKWEQKKERGKKRI